MYQVHLLCVFKVIYRVAKLTLIRLVGDAVGQHGQGRDYCRLSLLQVRLHSSLKTRGSECGTQTPNLGRDCRNFWPDLWSTLKSAC